jgi:hypothetical protein
VLAISIKLEVPSDTSTLQRMLSIRNQLSKARRGLNRRGLGQVCGYDFHGLCAIV